MTDSTTDRPDFGDLDGEIITALSLRLSGSGGLTRLPDAGEELTLIVTAIVTDSVKVDRDPADRLYRIHAAKVTSIAEAPAGSELADDVTSYLAGYQQALDELRGLSALPFEDETGESWNTEPAKPAASEHTEDDEEPEADDAT